MDCNAQGQEHSRDKHKPLHPAVKADHNLRYQQHSTRRAESMKNEQNAEKKSIETTHFNSDANAEYSIRFDLKKHSPSHKNERKKAHKFKNRLKRAFAKVRLFTLKFEKLYLMYSDIVYRVKKGHRGK